MSMTRRDRHLAIIGHFDLKPWGYFRDQMLSELGLRLHR